MDHSTLVLITSLHVVAALTATAINIGMNQRRLTINAQKDNNRLRAALYSELKKIRELYDENLTRLTQEDTFLLSGKTLTPIFRSNASRMNLLTESEIPTIVSAYLAHEYVEGLAAAVCKAKGTAYYIVPSRTPIEEVANAYAKARAEIDDGLAHLEPYLAKADPVRTAAARRDLGALLAPSASVAQRLGVLGSVRERA